MAERAARVLISIGGVGTIVAVTLIFVFLVWVVVPLFGARASTLPLPPGVDRGDGCTASRCGVRRDTACLGCRRSSRTERCVTWSRERRTSDRIAAQLFTTPSLTRSRRAITRARTGVRLRRRHASASARIGFTTTLPSHPRRGRHRACADVAKTGGVLQDTTLLEATNEGQLRAQSLAVDADAAARRRLAERRHRARSVGRRAATTSRRSTSTAKLVMSGIERSENLLTGEVHDDRPTTSVIPFASARVACCPTGCCSPATADTLYLALARRDPAALRRARHFERRGWRRSSTSSKARAHRSPQLTFLIGKTTLVSGDSRGRVRGWFRHETAKARHARRHRAAARARAVRPQAADHRVERVSSARASLCAGTQRRHVASPYHVTSQKLLCRDRRRQASPSKRSRSRPRTTASSR